EGIVSPHALIDRDDVCLVFGEVVGGAREARSLAVDREDVSYDVVAGAHSLQYLGVALGTVPNCAWPSGRGLATAGTVMSWIIHPSYQPLSLLMTNNGEMSVKTSLKARGLVG